MKKEQPTNERLCIATLDGDTEARNALVENNLRFIKRTAYEMWSAQRELNATLGIEINDLVQEGALGLLDCIPGYRPDTGNKFLTYAVPAIRNAMVDYIRSYNPTFEALAIMFEGSTASGAERAYRKAVDKLTELLVAEGAIHAIRLKQKSKTKCKKKIATAIYEYQADCDGEWGQISLNFENSTAEIVQLADWDTMKTNRFANKAITYLLNCENEKLPKETMVAFEL